MSTPWARCPPLPHEACAHHSVPIGNDLQEPHLHQPGEGFSRAEPKRYGDRHDGRVIGVGAAPRPHEYPRTQSAVSGCKHLGMAVRLIIHEKKAHAGPPSVRSPSVRHAFSMAVRRFGWMLVGSRFQRQIV